jgi:MFS family permease
MKKESMKILGIVLVSIMLVSLLTGIVAANGGTIFDPVRDLFVEWEEGQLSQNIAKYLFMALLTLLIYAISKHFPFLEKTEWYINGAISLVIAFLATAYLTPEEIYVMLTAYGAMGMIMGAIIPFIVITFFSIELAKKASFGGTLIQRIIWLGFGVFLIYKLIAGWANNLFGPLEFFLYLGILIVSLGMLVFNKQIMRKIFHSEIQATKEGLLREVEQGDALAIADKAKWKAARKRLSGKK